MPDGGAKASLAVTEAGRQAFYILRRGGDGRLAALFDHSFYIEFDHGWVCIGTDTLPMGPLNVRSSAVNDLKWASFGLQIDDKVSCRNGVVRVGHVADVALDNSLVWDPPVPPLWTVVSLETGLNALDQLHHHGNEEGLGAYVQADTPRGLSNRIVIAARQPIAHLSSALRHGFMSPSPALSGVDQAVTALLGLGPGLTPSGDDFLAGMLIALHIIGAADMRLRLDTVIERHAAQRTNAISIAHLRAAAAGAGHQALHEALNSLLLGDTESLPTRLAAIEKIGHSSGRDALAGVCVTLRAYLAAQ